jgi:hypothetical protein
MAPAPTPSPQGVGAAPRVAISTFPEHTCFAGANSSWWRANVVEVAEKLPTRGNVEVQTSLVRVPVPEFAFGALEVFAGAVVLAPNQRALDRASVAGDRNRREHRDDPDDPGDRGENG